MDLIDGEYNLYKIFTGIWNFTGEDTEIVPATEATNLSNIEGKALAFTPEFDAIKGELRTALNALASDTDPQIPETGAKTFDYMLLMQKLATGGKAHQLGNTLAKLAIENGITPVQTLTSTDGELTATVDTGYYLVTTKTTDIMQTTGITTMVAGDTTVTAKTSQPRLYKDIVLDTGQANYATVEMVDGRLPGITYNLRAVMPSNLLDKPNFALEIHDKLPTGLTTTTDEVKTQWNVTASLLVSQGALMVPLSDFEFDDITVVGGEIVFNSATFGEKMKELVENGTLATTTYSSSRVMVSVNYTPVFDDTDMTALFGTIEQADEPVTNTAYMKYTNNVYDPADTGLVKSVDVTATFQSFTAEILVKDLDGNSIAGAEFELQDSKGRVIKSDSANGVFQYAGLNLDTEYVLVNTTAVPGFEKKEDLHFKLKGVFDKAGNMTGVEVVVLSGGVEAPESVAIREDGNLGVLVNYICDKNTTPIVIPGTGAVPGLITIIVGIASLGTGTALVLKKEDE